MEPGRGFRSVVRIGPAGENLVSFANLNVDTFRHFGRLGPGAVFGSKKLKAMVVFGNLIILYLEKTRRLTAKYIKKFTTELPVLML